MVENNKTSQQKGNSGLANPQPVRNFSNKLDDVVWKDGYKDKSCSRGVVHGVWHTGAGVFTGNKAEFTRAGEQFNKCNPFKK